jgi:hypothetical protein
MKLAKLFGILSIMLASLPAVLAENIGHTVGRTMYRIFGWVFIDVFSRLGDVTIQFTMRFLIWLLLFALFFFGVSKVIKDQKNIQVTVAIALSLMGALLIPTTVLITLLKTYGGITVILLFVIPMAAVLYLNKFAFSGMSKAECALKAVSVYLLATIFHNMIGLEQMLEFSSLDAWIGFAEAVSIIAMIVYVVCAIFGWENKEGENSSDGDSSNGSSGSGNGSRENRATGSSRGNRVNNAVNNAAATRIPPQTPPLAGATFYPEITTADPDSGTASGRVRTR